MRCYMLLADFVQFAFLLYLIPAPPALDTHSLIHPFYINTENKAFSHVNTPISVAQGTMKPRTSGLFLLSHTCTDSHGLIRTHIKRKQTHTRM